MSVEMVSDTIDRNLISSDLPMPCGHLCTMKVRLGMGRELIVVSAIQTTLNTDSSGVSAHATN